ncbi:LysR family transcriptional regulator [Streptomyces flaveolus]|uniref:LysR family transcriptional regulator n=1 Tax=Streptomyces flaveolus TaxID=67297 RepID=UPI0033EB95B2
MKDLDLLATFLEIYRRGSLTAAATAMGISQPAVSGQLARLEEHLGDALFVRSRNGARPTGRGHELARRIGPHLDGLRHALGDDAGGEELPIVRRYWRSEFGHRPPNPVAVVVPDLRAVLVAVIAGAGISVLPRYLAEPALHAGSVEQLHRSAVPPLNTLYLVTRSGPLQPAVQRVQRRLVDQATRWGSL